MEGILWKGNGGSRSIGEVNKILISLGLGKGSKTEWGLTCYFGGRTPEEPDNRGGNRVTAEGKSKIRISNLKKRKKLPLATVKNRVSWKTKNPETVSGFRRDCGGGIHAAISEKRKN